MCGILIKRNESRERNEVERLEKERFENIPLGMFLSVEKHVPANKPHPFGMRLSVIYQETHSYRNASVFV